MTPNEKFPRKGIPAACLVAILVSISAALPLCFFGVLEVVSTADLEDFIHQKNALGAARLANISSFALKQKSIAEITQLLSDKATSVDNFFRDTQRLLLLERSFAERAWTAKTPAPRNAIMRAEVMRDPSKLPPDARLERIRGCIISYAAPMAHRPAGVAPEVERREWPMLARLGFELKSILAQDKRLLFTYMGTVNGMLLTFPADNSLKHDYDPRKREWYKKAVAADGIVWTAPYEDAGTKVMVMSCAAPVKVNGRLVGVVGLDVRLDVFVRDVLSLKPHPNWSVALVDGEGAFITIPNLADAEGAPPKSAKDFFGADALGRILKGNEEMFEFEFRDVERLAGAKRIPSVDWIMMVAVPSDVALELSKKIRADFQETADTIEAGIARGLRHAIERLVSTAAMLTFIAFLLAILIGSVVGRRVQDMADMAEQVAKGDFTVRAPIKGAQEMRALARSFNSMAADLADYTERVAREAADRQRIATELDTARKIQAALIPEDFPAMPHTDVHAVWQPARETAGDFYDIFDLPGGFVGVVMADVSGKGVGAAVFMTMTRALLRSAAREANSPADALREVNAALAADEEIGMFVTAIYAVYDPTDGRVAIADAGHVPPLLRRGGECEWLETEGGPPLAVLQHDMYENTDIALDPGDMLFLYTDGVTEAMDPQGRLFNDERLIKLFESHPDATAAQACEQVLDAIDRWAAGQPQSDDICLLALRRTD